MKALVIGKLRACSACGDMTFHPEFGCLACDQTVEDERRDEPGPWSEWGD